MCDAPFAFGAGLAPSARVMLAPITIEGVDGGGKPRRAASRRFNGPTISDRLLPLYSRREIRRRARELADEIRRDYRGSDLVVEDLLDTGRTLAALLADLRGRGARSVRVCALPDKPERRAADVRADYVGFEDVRGFVAGYGIDFAERYRERPDLVAVERPSGGRPS